MFKSAFGALVIFAALLAPIALEAGNIASDQLYAVGGPVSVFFISSSAGLDSRVLLDLFPESGPFLGNHTSTPGESITIANLATNTLVPLRLEVLQTGEEWFVGPARLNSDNAVHALTSPWAPNALVPVAGILVEFEDWTGGGDKDYDDARYVVTGVSTGEIPEPGTMLLLGSALIGAGALRFRGRAKD